MANKLRLVRTLICSAVALAALETSGASCLDVALSDLQPKKTEPHVLARKPKFILPRYSRLGPSMDLESFGGNRYSGGAYTGRRVFPDGSLGPDVRPWARLDRLGPGYEELIVDEGLVFHLDEFEQWVKSREGARPSPQAARDEFAKSLGTRKMYRALALTSEEFESILKNGLFPYGQTEESLRAPGKNLRPVNSSVEHHINNVISNYHEIQSFTEYPDIGLAVGKEYAMDPSGKAKTVYLFEVEVPEIDLLYINYGDRILSVKRGFPADFSGSLRVKGTDGKARSYSYGPKVESFTINPVPPENIVSWKEFSVSECPDYEWSGQRR
jgi:hypothetical protein